MPDKNDNDPRIPKEIQRHLSNAKRHHYVPEFLLRRFCTNPVRATPADEHPLICRLDIATGAVKMIPTNNCAVVQQYNQLSPESGLPAGFAEAMLAYTEAEAVPLIEKLIHGGILDLKERVDFSTFLMAQQMRTPRGREWQRFARNRAATFWVLNDIHTNRDITKEWLRKNLGREPTENEIDESIRQMAEPLENGKLEVSVSRDMEILGMFVPAPELVPLIGEMNWTVLEAPAEQSFILSDDPLVRVDPLNPDGPAGWRSSPSVEVTMPLDPRYCLRLRQPPIAQSTRVVTADEVLDTNLRTYAGAREFIFGPTKQLVEGVYAAAKANEFRVDLFRPKPPNIYVLERMEGEEEPPKVTRIPGPQEIKIRRGKKK